MHTLAWGNYYGKTYFGEELEEIATLVKVNEDVKLLEGFEVLLKNHTLLLQTHAHVIIVRLWDLDELKTTGLGAV